jgi:hypothetical protein
MRKITILNGFPDGTHSDFENLLAAQLEKHADTLSAEIFTLRNMKIGFCTGCWDCWVKTPGLCAIKDDMPSILKSVAASDRTVFLSPISMDFVTSQIKKTCDRMIPLVHPYVEVYHGEFHHKSRYESYPELGLIIIDPEKDAARFEVIREIFARLSLNLKTTLPLSMMIDGADQEVSNAVSSL